MTNYSGNNDLYRISSAPGHLLNFCLDNIRICCEKQNTNEYNKGENSILYYITAVPHSFLAHIILYLRIVFIKKKL